MIIKCYICKSKDILEITKYFEKLGYKRYDKLYNEISFKPTSDEFYCSLWDDNEFTFTNTKRNRNYIIFDRILKLKKLI